MRLFFKRTVFSDFLETILKDRIFFGDFENYFERGVLLDFWELFWKKKKEILLSFS